MLLREVEIGVRLFQQLRLQLFISFLFCHPVEMNGLLQVLRHQFHSYPTPSPGCAALIGSRVRQSNDRAPLHARNAALASSRVSATPPFSPSAPAMQSGRLPESKSPGSVNSKSLPGL